MAVRAPKEAEAGVPLADLSLDNQMLKELSQKKW